MLRVFLSIAFIAGCSFDPGGTGGSGTVDGAPDDTADADPDAPDAELADAFADLGSFATPVRIDEVSSGAGEDDPCLTGDLLEMYFDRGGDIFSSTRTSVAAAWGTPVMVSELSSGSAEGTPQVAANGLVMFFSSQRSDLGSLGDHDVFMSTRASRTDVWGTPVHVPELSSSGSDLATAPTPDLLAITISSTRSGAGGQDAFMSTRANPDDPWGTPVPIPDVNTAADERNAFFARGTLDLYMDLDYGGGPGGYDIYVFSRATTSDAFGPPVLVPELSTTDSETDLWISEDGHYAVFERNGDIYETSR